VKPIDYLKAAGVGVAVLALTLALSYPMVAFYAYFIEPGHPQQFYRDAAQWIAPWSSHVFGPILFFAFNYWLARRSPGRNAVAFAIASFAAYVVIDWGMALGMGLSLGVMLVPSVAVSLAAKLAGGLAGAYTAEHTHRSRAMRPKDYPATS
jgi:hypothetical protein